MITLIKDSDIPSITPAHVPVTHGSSGRPLGPCDAELKSHYLHQRCNFSELQFLLLESGLGSSEVVSTGVVGTDQGTAARGHSSDWMPHGIGEKEKGSMGYDG